MNSLTPFNNKNSFLLSEPVDYLKPAELLDILRAVDLHYDNSSKTDHNTWMRDRDKLLFQVLWTTGARISDVLDIRTENIKIKEQSITFLVHKRRSKKAVYGGEFWHTISLDLQTLTDILEYMQVWSIKSGLLFTANISKPQPLTRAAVNKKLNQLTASINMRHVHPHMFRHGLAMHLQSQGVPVEVIAFRLAHSSTAITLQTYARMNIQQEKSILEALNVQLR